MDAKKCKELGIPAGPLYKKLKDGEDVILDNGTVVAAAEVLGEMTKGLKICVLQDTMDSQFAIETCRDANLVVHEATFEKGMREDALAKGHSTSDMAAQFAVDCGAKILALTHFSSRYIESSSSSNEKKKNKKSDGDNDNNDKGNSDGSDPTLLLKIEAEEVFKGQVIIAKDFMALDNKLQPMPGLQASRNPWSPY